MPLQKIRKSFSSFLKKKKKIKWGPILLLVLFSVCFFATRLPRLKDDVINPDGVLWHGRSEQFIVGIKYGQFEKTYQHYHPGVTLTWIVGSSVEIFKQISGVSIYNSNTFETFDLVAKIALVSVQFVLSIFIIFSLSKLIGFYKSLIIVSLFTFEPFFLAGSRLLHLDAISTLFVFLALIFGFMNLEKPKTIISIATGFFLAMSFLTKSICIGALFYIIAYTIFYLISSKKRKYVWPAVLTIFLSFVFFTFLFFPALWKDPGYYLMDMVFGESERVGMREGHRQIFFGEQVMDAGVLFYPLITLMKISPFMLLGILFFIYFIFRFKKDGKGFIKKLKDSLLGFGPYLAVFYLGYILFMTVATKKLDRYIIMMFPLFAYTSFLGYRKVCDSLKNSKSRNIFRGFILVSVVLFIIVPYFSLFPWYFTYTSPLFGKPETANKIIGQKPFGVGVPDLKSTIIDRYSDEYGGEPRLGFYDTQPIRAVYPNSKIFDVRVYGPSSYDILVLAINEDMPDKVVKSDDYEFEKDESIWINGLEYWRIYVRKDKAGD